MMRTNVNGSSVLEWFVAPLTTEQFLSDYFGQNIFVSAGASDRFKSTLSLEDLDEVLGTYGLRFPEIQAVLSDEDIPVDSYTLRNRLVDPMRIARLFREGATLIFTALHDHHERVRQLCTRFALEANARTQANIYLTPPNSQGFKPHWDSHDVFILQISGTKRWQIFGNVVQQPMPPDKFDPKVHEPGEVVDEFVLEAGGMLYIPRGITHAGVSTDETSLHITLGLIAYTWTDLIIDCVVELSERDVELRKHLPFGFARPGSAGYEKLRESWESVAQDVVSRLDPEAVVQARVDQFNSAHRPRVKDHLRQALSVGSLERDHVVSWRPILPGRIEPRGDRVGVICGGRDIEFPSSATATINALIEGAVVRAGEIDDALDWETRKIVLSTLKKEGMIFSLESPT